jgi:phage portal protein BeeE
LLSASAANYATSINDKITFLNQTVLPEAALIEETLNEQLFGPLGLVFAFEPDRLEEFQQHEVEKTKSLVPLVEAGIMTKAEARKWLGLEETDEQHEPCG